LATGFSSFVNSNFVFQVFDPLVMRDNTGLPVPGLAESWRPIDETTWRFELRKGVAFQDDKPFTSADVKFTLDYILAPDSTYGLKSRISQIASVETDSDHAVIIKTKGPFPTIINGIAEIAIEPKHYVEAVGRSGITAKPMGTGPFRYKRWVPGDRYELSANNKYWGGPPTVQELIFRQIPEGSTRVSSLVAGEVQIAEELPIDLIDTVAKSRVAEVASIETSVGLVLTFDTRKPPFDKPRVRLALAHAINRELILQQLLLGQGTLLQGQLVTSNTFGFNPNIKPFAYDPARAKALLAEAGYPNGFETSIATRSGKYLADVEICNAIAAMLADIGVRTNVNVVEEGVWSKMTAARDSGPMHMIGWYSLNDADFATIWYTEASRRSVWKNEEYEKLFVAARSTVDESTRLKHYHRMMEILHAELPSLFLFGLPSIYGKAKSLQGWLPPSDKILRVAKARVA
jgi:peptide/nickel transport system substrate-binding protein